MVQVLHGCATTTAAVAASVADATVLPPDLLHGDETRVRGDQAYRSNAR